MSVINIGPKVPRLLTACLSVIIYIGLIWSTFRCSPMHSDAVLYGPIHSDSVRCRPMQSDVVISLSGN